MWRREKVQIVVFIDLDDYVLDQVSGYHLRKCLLSLPKVISYLGLW